MPDQCKGDRLIRMDRKSATRLPGHHTRLRLQGVCEYFSSFLCFQELLEQSFRFKIRAKQLVGHRELCTVNVWSL